VHYLELEVMHVMWNNYYCTATNYTIYVSLIEEQVIVLHINKNFQRLTNYWPELIMARA